MWSDWESILAETLRAVLETKCHPQSLKDAEYNLRCYDQQVAEEKAKKLLTKS